MGNEHIDPVAHVDAFLDKVFDRLDAAWGPVWEGQHEMARTLITLSSGALVVTVSLVQFIAERLPHPAWPWLLPASWVCFGLSVVSGVLRHGWSSRARGLRVHFEYSRSALREAIRGIPRDHNWAERADEAMVGALEKANVDPAKAIKVHDALIAASGWGFILGLAALLLFAIRNLPF